MNYFEQCHSVEEAKNATGNCSCAIAPIHAGNI
jgi:hypothetical protein